VLPAWDRLLSARRTLAIDRDRADPATKTVSVRVFAGAGSTRGAGLSSGRLNRLKPLARPSLFTRQGHRHDRGTGRRPRLRWRRWAH